MREQIAAAGRAEVLARHTYRHRMQQLLAKTGATVAGSRAYSSPHAPREVSRAVEAMPHAPEYRERITDAILRREVIDQVGLFDERFGIGNFEGDDFCRRARDAGWRLVVVQDAFIHHFGHRSFEAAQIGLNALLQRNQHLYNEKWAAERAGNRAQGTEGN